MAIIPAGGVAQRQEAEGRVTASLSSWRFCEDPKILISVLSLPKMLPIAIGTGAKSLGARYIPSSADHELVQA